LGNISGEKLGNTHPTTRCDCVEWKWTCYDWTVCSGVQLQPVYKTRMNEIIDSLTKVPLTSAATKTPLQISKAPIMITKAPASITKAPIMITKAPARITKAPTIITKAPTKAPIKFTALFPTKAPVIAVDSSDPAPTNDALCPKIMPQSRSMAPLGLTDRAVCEYGSLCCCGDCDTKVHCINNAGIFHCLTLAIECAETCSSSEESISMAAERAPVVDKCPLENGFMPPGSVCASDLRCTYGTESCCGKTFPSLVCVCSGGDSAFACFMTDACMEPKCDIVDVPNIELPEAPELILPSA